MEQSDSSTSSLIAVTVMMTWPHAEVLQESGNTGGRGHGVAGSDRHGPRGAVVVPMVGCGP